MALSNKKIEQIAQIVIQVLHTNFEVPANGIFDKIPFRIMFDEVFHASKDDDIEHSDFINLSSWMHGLNTSLGQSFFESVAHILCDGQKKDFKGKQIYSEQMTAIGDIMIDLKNGVQSPSVEREDTIIAEHASGEQQTAPNFTADCFYETDTDVVALELKSVRPNSGEMRGEKQKILIGKAVLRELYPDKNVKYLFGFPFDPTASGDAEYDKPRFLKYLVEAEKFIAHEDFLIADELWSFLAGSDGAMQEILDIINTIATPEFMDKFNKLQDTSTPKDEKRDIFNEWHLYSEIDILDKVSKTRNNQRIFNQSIFKTDGAYNSNRQRLLE